MGSIVPDPSLHVLVLGGCYAGLAATLNLLDFCAGKPPRCGPPPAADGGPPFLQPIPGVRVTIVDERDGYYHLIGSPLALASATYTERAWVKFSDIPALQTPQVEVVQGRASKVNCQEKTATILLTGSNDILSLDYDYLVVATGLRRVWPVVPQSLRRKAYLHEAGDHIKALSISPRGVVFVGGGAVGIEMAAELKVVQPHIKITLAHSHSALLSAEPLPEDVKDRALVLTQESGVNVLLDHRLDKAVEKIGDDGSKYLELVFANGHTMNASQVIMAVSRSVPSTDFLPTDALDPDGYVKIRPSLQFPPSTPNSTSHFAAGDLVSWSGIKRCGAAMHMGYLVSNNIHQRILQDISDHTPQLLGLDPIPPMIGLAVGRKALAYDPEGGLISGEDVMKLYFGDDLGFGICWNWMRLGEKPEAA